MDASPLVLWRLSRHTAAAGTAFGVRVPGSEAIASILVEDGDAVTLRVEICDAIGVARRVIDEGGHTIDSVMGAATRKREALALEGWLHQETEELQSRIIVDADGRRWFERAESDGTVVFRQRLRGD